MKRPEIARRSILSEVLRLAFTELGADDPNVELGQRARSVRTGGHWPHARVSAWLSDNRAVVEEVADAFSPAHARAARAAMRSSHGS